MRSATEHRGPGPADPARPAGHWRCGRCQADLEMQEVATRYAHGGLLMTLARCPRCGLTLVPKTLAEDHMVDMQRRMEETWNGV